MDGTHLRKSLYFFDFRNDSILFSKWRQRNGQIDKLVPDYAFDCRPCFLVVHEDGLLE